MIPATPRVSVLLSVYNGERYLAEAVSSILQQTFADFELIAIDDGSSDNTAAILATFADPRLIVRRNDSNCGLASALNQGLALSHGEYIARMDADDVMLPTRLAQQVSLLDRQPDIGVVGTWMKLITDEGQPCGVFEVACDHEMIAWTLLFGSKLAHPTVMIRRTLIEQVSGYQANVITEDIDLWVRLVERTRFANLPDALLLYRQHDASVSRVHQHKRQVDMWRIEREWLSRLLNDAVSPEQMTWLVRSQDVQRSLQDGLSEEQIACVIRLMLQAYQALCDQRIIRAEFAGPVYDDLIQRIMAASRYSPRLVAPGELARYWNKASARNGLRIARAIGRRLQRWPDNW